MDNDKFPKIKKEIMNFIDDEEGNITRSKILTVGSLVVLLGMITTIDAYAAHSSHKSHSSHSSTSYHKSHVSHTSSKSHSNHSSSHGSHSSHSNATTRHYSHGSHSNVTTTKPAPTTSHSNVTTTKPVSTTIIKEPNLSVTEQTTDVYMHESVSKVLTTNNMGDIYGDVVPADKAMATGFATATAATVAGATAYKIKRKKENKK